MIPIFPDSPLPPMDMLAETQKLYRWSAEELIRAITALREGTSTADAKGAAQAIRDLKTTLGWAIDEKNNVEKLGKSLAAAAAGTAGQGYDLDSARDEIGRRLANLRAARGDDTISGGSVG